MQRLRLWLTGDLELAPKNPWPTLTILASGSRSLGAEIGLLRLTRYNYQYWNFTIRYPPVATPYFKLIFTPSSTSASVIEGCKRLWSIIFARSLNDKLRELGILLRKTWPLELHFDLPVWIVIRVGSNRLVKKAKGRTNQQWSFASFDS